MVKTLKKVGILRFLCSVTFVLTILALIKSPETVVLASEGMTGYKNPQDIVITAPKDKFSTSSSQISILGASDYRYPIYMNGELLQTTSYGFFTSYVDLEVGDNEFVFENNGKIKTLTITRKKKAAANSSSGSNSSVQKVTYKEYTSVNYAVVVSDYVMPRTKINSSDVSLMPLVKGTTFRLIGEDGNYYKIADGTYVSKSSVKKYENALDSNKVSKVIVTDDMIQNVVSTKLTMNMNTLYKVTVNPESVDLTLYDTVSVKQAKVGLNDTIRSVAVSVDKKNKTATYRYSLYEGSKVSGYDIKYIDGVMIFELKKAPHLKNRDSLEGATIYLDAGHGNTDTGALGPLSTLGPMEKDINLSITLYTKEYLEKLGAKVVLTRKDDTFLSLSDRVKAIRNTMPDISVSIHGNSLDVHSNYSKTSGFLTYFSYQLFGDVPGKINESVANSLGFQVKEARRSSLSLTRLTTCPAVLLETMFLSNPRDYEYLLQDSNQILFAEAIGIAVKEYIEENAVYDGEQFFHSVEKGETLSFIAKKYGVSLKSIVSINQIEDINHIKTGQKLKISY